MCFIWAIWGIRPAHSNINILVFLFPKIVVHLVWSVDGLQMTDWREVDGRDQEILMWSSTSVGKKKRFNMDLFHTSYTTYSTNVKQCRIINRDNTLEIREK